MPRERAGKSESQLPLPGVAGGHQHPDVSRQHPTLLGHAAGDAGEAHAAPGPLRCPRATPRDTRACLLLLTCWLLAQPLAGRWGGAWGGTGPLSRPGAPGDTGGSGERAAAGLEQAAAGGGVGWRDQGAGVSPDPSQRERVGGREGAPTAAVGRCGGDACPSPARFWGSLTLLWGTMWGLILSSTGERGALPGARVPAPPSPWFEAPLAPHLGTFGGPHQLLARGCTFPPARIPVLVQRGAGLDHGQGECGESHGVGLG